MISLLPRTRCLSLLDISSNIHQVKQIHAQLIINSLMSQDSTISKLIEAYFVVSNGGEEHARYVFQSTSNSSSLASNIMLCCSKPADALKLFAFGTIRDCISCKSVLRACTKLRAFREGKQVHALIIKHGFVSSVVVQTMVVYFYATCRDIYSARHMFDEMPTRSVVTWNAMMTGYCLNGLLLEAFLAFTGMRYEGFEVTDRTAVVLVSVCSQLGDLRMGTVVHAFVLKAIAVCSYCVFIGTRLVDMYSKCGCVTSALKVFYGMPEKNLLTWTSMITGLALHGEGKAALRMLCEMEKNGLMPNAITFTSLLTACCYGGLVDEGLYLFSVMRSKYSVKPCMQHYGCMVDLLGRAGMVDDAYHFVKNMPIEPDAAVWRALLGACNMHKQSELGEKVGKILLSLKNHASHRAENFQDYVALSNMYASAQRWENVSLLRQAMKKTRTHHRPGQSLA